MLTPEYKIKHGTGNNVKLSFIALFGTIHGIKW